MPDFAFVPIPVPGDKLVFLALSRVLSLGLDSLSFFSSDSFGFQLDRSRADFLRALWFNVKMFSF